MGVDAAAERGVLEGVEDGAGLGLCGGWVLRRPPLFVEEGVAGGGASTTRSSSGPLPASSPALSDDRGRDGDEEGRLRRALPLREDVLEREDAAADWADLTGVLECCCREDREGAGAVFGVEVAEVDLRLGALRALILTRCERTAAAMGGAGDVVLIACSGRGVSNEAAMDTTWERRWLGGCQRDRSTFKRAGAEAQQSAESAVSQLCTLCTLHLNKATTRQCDLSSLPHPPHTVLSHMDCRCLWCSDQRKGVLITSHTLHPPPSHTLFDALYQRATVAFSCASSPSPAQVSLHTHVVRRDCGNSSRQKTPTLASLTPFRLLCHLRTLSSCTAVALCDVPLAREEGGGGRGDCVPR